MANQPVIMGTLLEDTTQKAPAPMFPENLDDPEPGCSICAQIIAQTVATYDPTGRHLNLQVPSTLLAQLMGLKVDVIVQVAANVAARRYTPPAQALGDLTRARPNDWYLPLSAPQAPSAMAIVFTFQRSAGDAVHTVARSVAIG